MHNFRTNTMKTYTLTFILFLIALTSFGQTSDYEKGIEYFENENHLKAFYLLKPFADKGDSKAELIVGVCYFNPELEIKNDSLSLLYLTRSAEQFNTDAMKLLTMIYFEKGAINSKYRVESLVWAEISGAYDQSINFTTTRYLIREYLNEDELNEVEKELKVKSKKFDKINLEAFYALNKRVKQNNQNSEKSKIPENTLKLAKNPYFDWVYRWKLERFECDTMYYTAEIEDYIIDSTINRIKQSREFEVHFLYRGDDSKPFEISTKEQSYLIKELEKLKNHRWDADIFPYSKRLEHKEIQAVFDLSEKLPTEKEKNMCAIVYTFSKPIFIRNGSVVLYLSQQRYRGNYTQLDFMFYELNQNERWENLAKVYSYYESGESDDE